MSKECVLHERYQDSVINYMINSKEYKLSVESYLNLWIFIVISVSLSVLFLKEEFMKLIKCLYLSSSKKQTLFESHIALDSAIVTLHK